MMKLSLGLSLLCLPAIYGNSTTCSPWSKFDPITEVCICPDIAHGLLHCNKSGYLDAVLDCACITYDEISNVIEVGFCIYGCSRKAKSKYGLPAGYSALPPNISRWNDRLCGPFRRKGTLCGACQNGTYAPAYSYDMKCLQCNNGKDNLWLYLLWGLGPLTLFYALLLFLPVNVVSSKLMGFVFYSQMISLPTIIRPLLINKRDRPYIPQTTRSLAAFYGIWNLDFFRTFNSGICLETDTLATLTLDLLIATYPLFLIVITYLMIVAYDNEFRPLAMLLKPFLLFGKRNWKMKTSIFDSFVTFTLLSNVKLLNLCADLLTPVSVYQFITPLNITHSRRLYYDSTVEYFGSKHLPYAICAIMVMFIFILLPTSLLIFYPFQAIQKCINLLPGRFQLFLNTFVDSFQGCYKNGTEPHTRDYRYLSSLHFIMRPLVLITYCTTLNALFQPYAPMVLVLAVISIINLDPFKGRFQYMSYDWQMHILFLVCFCSSATILDIVQVYMDQTPFSILAVSIIGMTSILPVIYYIMVIIYCYSADGKLCILARLKLLRQQASH